MPQIPQNMRIVLLFKTYGCFNHLQMPVNVHWCAKYLGCIKGKETWTQKIVEDEKPGEPKGNDYCKLAKRVQFGMAGDGGTIRHRSKRKDHSSSFLIQFE